MTRRYHANSIFGPGPRRAIPREARARFRMLAKLHRRAGTLTAAFEDVAEALVRRLGDDGRCDPTKATLAADAGPDERTVTRALDRMRDIGLIRWTRRLVRNGWRCEQTSNAYELLPDLCQPPACDGQPVRQTRRKIDIPTVRPDLTVDLLALAARRSAALGVSMA